MIKMAENGHFLIQIPQPSHNSSEITGFPSAPMTTVSSPVCTIGQYFMHSIAHFFG
jgi:hypothetical protein